MDDLYVSWVQPIKRARIHRGNCRHCNHGAGQTAQQTTGSGNTSWLGPMGLAEAEEEIRSLRKQGYRDLAKCGLCLRPGL
jgi:hypothetical protein